MALLNKIKKDVKKSSYYVWFLGAQESKGLRGAEYIVPVLKCLVQREKTVEPFKITLQVSQKGLKIVQNVPNHGGGKKLDFKLNKNDVVKHVIPHHAVTSVYQEEDVVACVLLLYNPVTRCPVHVHAYRCDTIETATLLTQQLSSLIDRPENQRKMNEIEAKLQTKGLLMPTMPRVNIAKRVNSSGSDGLSTTSPASESSAGSSSGGQERLHHLYDSLASELREKLGISTDGRVTHAPILLPPRDYDTVHRQKGNLTGIELRRCLNENIIGAKSDGKGEKNFMKATRLGRMMDSSGGSSGIGSDHHSSPDDTSRSQNTNNGFMYNQGQCTTSDEEWPEPSRKQLASQPKKCEPEVTPGKSDKLDKSRNDRVNHFMDSPESNLRVPIENFRKRNEKGSMSPVGVVAPRRRVQNDEESYKKRIPDYKGSSSDKKGVATPPCGTMKLSPQERFLDAKTKFLMMEKERLQEHEKKVQILERKKISTVEAPISPEIIKTRPHWSKEERVLPERACLARRNSFFDDQPIASAGKSNVETQENVVDKKQRISRSDSCAALLSYKTPPPRDVNERQQYKKGFDYGKAHEVVRVNSYDRNEDMHNRVDRNDGEVFRRVSQERRSNFRSPVRMLPDEDTNSQWFQQPSKRRDMGEPKRYLSPSRDLPRQSKHLDENVPYGRQNKSKPRSFDQKFKNPFSSSSKRSPYDEPIHKMEIPKTRNLSEREYLERRASVGAYQPCSDYGEDEDIRKDYRSNIQYPYSRGNPSAGFNRESSYHDADMFHNNASDMDAIRASQLRMERLPARYRHSFVDPESSNSRLHTHDLIQRTNSNVSSSRVGIAAVHHY